MLRMLVLWWPLALLGCGGDDPATGSSGPQSTCAVDLDCDDGLACTVDTCLPVDGGKNSKRFCNWLVAAGQCLVDGVCAGDGAARPGNACERCAAASPLVWVAAPSGITCDDTNVCTTNDTCLDRVCGGVPIDCGDGNACTRDGCDIATGCTHDALDGFSCDDGVRCTVDDRCHDSACGGVANACDDNDPCTVDACGELAGCTHEAQPRLACDDGDACTSNDVCQDGVCGSGPATNCDDDNACTIDVCDALAGCVQLPTQSPCCIGETSVCDDGNACTDDACDPETLGCTHVPNRAPCEDGNPCSSDDFCAAGACVGGGDHACDDGNPCTSDSCKASLAELCLHAAVEGACDDGVACTTADVCSGGQCIGDASACVCVPDLSSDGVKLTSIVIGSDGGLGEGVDVDGDAATCAPSGCSGGVDNTLSILAGFANDPLGDAVRSGQVSLVVEFGPLTASPIEVAVYQASLAATNPRCAVQTQTCDWLVAESFLDPTSCEPVARLTATLTGKRLVGGGPGTRLPFSIPFNGANLDIVVANLRLEVDLTIVAGLVTGMSGVLGGAVPKATLLEGLEGLPDDALPVPKAAAVSLVESLVVNDIDTDQDGAKDAASIGIKLLAIDARLVGVGP